MKVFFIFILMICFVSTTKAQLVVAPGSVTHISIANQLVKIKTQNAYIQVSVYTPEIIRVRMNRQPLGKDFSYAVVAEAAKVKTTITQNAREIRLSTDSVIVVMQKQPFSIAFYTPDDKVINEDAIGLNTSWVDNSVTTYKKLQPGERFMGLGEKSGDLDRAGSGYTNWNTDAVGYDNKSDPLYSSIPFYIGIHHNLSYGIFLDNTYQTDFNFGASNNEFSSFGARGGEMNYYFLYNQSVAGIIKDYTFLTGRMKMPPLWSLGYQQSKWSYYPDTMVMRVAHELRAKNFPADGMVLDINYMNKYQLFTWDSVSFPHPRQMTDSLLAMGFRTTVIVDPGINVAPGMPAYEKGVKEDVYLKYPNGKYYAGAVWPGWCNFTDFTNEKGRAYWRNQMRFFVNSGVSGVWNDMNEISTWGQKTPDNILYNYDGLGASNLQGHNVYGLEMVRSSFEGMKNITHQRPFILSRSGYAGLQRYSAIWTGDNQPTEEHMLLGVRLLNSMGLSGLAFTGMDISGFLGNATASLFIRWMEIGAFIPYCRNHKMTGLKPAEPWNYGENALNVSRSYIELRYHLLPYIYSTFYEATQNGMPVNRSLAIDYTYDENIYNTQFQNQYLFGDALMIAPFESTTNTGKAYFPEGDWYDFFTDKRIAGNTKDSLNISLEKLPVFVKAGSIIPMQSVVESTSQLPTDTLTLHIYNGDKGSSFVYYEDDGESYKYQNGDFYKRKISLNPKDRAIAFSKPEGSFISKFHYLKLVFHGFEDVKGKVAQAYFTAIPYKISEQKELGATPVFAEVVTNNNEEFEVKY
jgi:alpha-glucosidase